MLESPHVFEPGLISAGILDRAKNTAPAYLEFAISRNRSGSVVELIFLDALVELERWG